MEYDKLKEYLQLNYKNINIVKCSIDDLVFEERVKLNCLFCDKYDVSWRCPPKISNIDYAKIFSEYRNSAFIYVDMNCNIDTYSQVRIDSSVYLHKVLLNLEDFLMKNNIPLAVSFIGGSCKLCKNGCGKEKCNNPYQARIPLEATGVNVVKSVQKYGINIEFPANTHIIRIGMLLW